MGEAAAPSGQHVAAPQFLVSRRMQGRRVARGWGGRLAIGWIVVVVAAAVLAPVLPLADPYASTGSYRATPSWPHLLGTDRLGRDILARSVFGARASLQIVVTVIAISMSVGLVLGMLSGYVRGAVEFLVTALCDLVLSLPGLVLLLVLVALRGASIGNLILGMAILVTPAFVRLARANTLRFSTQEFVAASRGIGATGARILRRELLPNVLPPMRVYAMAAAAQVLVAEGSLSFLGLGVPPPTPSWGGMINDGRSIFTDSPHVVIVPSVVLLATVSALNLIGVGTPSRR